MSEQPTNSAPTLGDLMQRHGGDLALVRAEVHEALAKADARHAQAVADRKNAGERIAAEDRNRIAISAVLETLDAVASYRAPGPAEKVSG